jgi:hypothetical protein
MGIFRGPSRGWVLHTALHNSMRLFIFPCAGNAGMLRLYLYARVRTSRALLHTRPRVQQAPGIPCALFTLGETICKARAKRAAGTRRCVQPSLQRMDFQWLWIDPGEMLPVMSDPSSEMRQAATPKNAVSIKAATSKIIEEKWPTPWPRNRHCTQFQRTSTVCRVGKCSRADLNEVFPRRGIGGGNAVRPFGPVKAAALRRGMRRLFLSFRGDAQHRTMGRPGMTVRTPSVNALLTIHPARIAG